jgi:uncharacterized protein
MAQESAARPRALITGASSGIGLAFAERLTRDGYDLILVARDEARLNALAERLSAAHGVTAEALPADLAQPGPLRAVEARLAADPALELLVNNAGFGAYMPFTSLDPDVAEELIRVQVVAVTRLTRAALPGMIERGHGAVINVSSMLAFSGAMPAPRLPKRAVYAGSKAFINTFTMLLSDELQGTGVRLQALCPGIVATEFHQRQGIDDARFPPELLMSAADVVAASLTGLRLGEVVCAPSLADTALLAEVFAAPGRLFEHGRARDLAERYRSWL